MPDIATHVLAAYLFKKASGINPLALFLLGTMLPDILSRPLYMLFPGLFWAVRPFHSIFVIALVCLLISYLFPEAARKSTLKVLFAGAMLHLFLDLLQKTIYGGYPWLFPFSTYSPSLGLFWPEDPLFALPFLAAISLAIYIKTRKMY